ncbi:MAG: Hsp20/alpha crystallin family protein [Saprospiraceae bacterium]|nr:Hsp20/alpha crystallin family protein [Saprospiraceae bacterium]
MSTKSMVKTGFNVPAVFNDFFKPWTEWMDEPGSLWVNTLRIPPVNIVENGKDYKVSLGVPGMKKEDFKIEHEGNILTISSEKSEDKEERDEKFTRKEFNYSAFSRSFTLPENVLIDKIEAKYQDGVLELSLPKKEPVKKTEHKKIEIK